MEYTEEQSADFQTRANAFNEEYLTLYEELKKKHECEFVYNPVTVPGPTGFFGLSVSQNIGDLKFKSIPSPVQMGDDKLIAE